MTRYFDVLLVAFCSAVVITPFLRLLAFRFGILDHPKQHGIHSHPVPRLGGVAIYAAFVIGTLYRLDLSHNLKGVLVGATIIFLTGLVDDVFRLRARFKLIMQFVACVVMIYGYGIVLDVFPNGYGLNTFFTILGIIGMTNAVNFLDNMDGLSSGLVAISSFTIFIVAYATHQIWLGYLALALTGAAIGFLVFNMKPAYFFMGDSGSTFLGFTMASLAVMADWSYYLPVSIAVPLWIMGVPIIDMTLITALRIKEDKIKSLKEWIDYTGKDHISHRFMRLGLGKRGAVFYLWVLQALFCFIGYRVLPCSATAGVIAFVSFWLVTVGIIIFFRKRRGLLLAWKGRSSERNSIARSR